MITRVTPGYNDLDFMGAQVDNDFWAHILSAGKGRVESERGTAVAALRSLTAHCTDIAVQRLPQYSVIIERRTAPSGFFKPGMND